MTLCAKIAPLVDVVPVATSAATVVNSGLRFTVTSTAPTVHVSVAVGLCMPNQEFAAINRDTTPHKIVLQTGNLEHTVRSEPVMAGVKFVINERHTRSTSGRQRPSGITDHTNFAIVEGDMPTGSDGTVAFVARWSGVYCIVLTLSAKGTEPVTYVVGTELECRIMDYVVDTVNVPQPLVFTGHATARAFITAGPTAVLYTLPVYGVVSTPPRNKSAWRVRATAHGKRSLVSGSSAAQRTCVVADKLPCFAEVCGGVDHVQWQTKLPHVAEILAGVDCGQRQTKLLHLAEICADRRLASSCILSRRTLSPPPPPPDE